MSGVRRLARGRRSLRHMLDRRLRQDAVSEIEDVRPAAHGVQDVSMPSSRASPPAIRARGSRLPWVASPAAGSGRTRAGSRVQSSASASPMPGRREAVRGGRRRRARTRSPAPAGARPSARRRSGGSARATAARTGPAAGPRRSSRRSAPPRRPHRSGGSDRRSRLDEPVDQRRHEGRIAVGGEPGGRLVGRALAGDHVARHRPGRAAEAEERGLRRAGRLSAGRGSRRPERGARGATPRRAA